MLVRKGKAASIGWTAALALVAFACDSGTSEPSGPPRVSSLFSTDATAGFFDAPFPVEHMRRPDGTIRYDLLPNPEGNPVVRHYIGQASREAAGFSRAGPVFIPFDGPVDARGLPSTPEESLSADSKVFLVNVDETSSRYRERIPVHAKWQGEEKTYVPANVLVLLPYQGYPLAPDAFHAAVVLKDLGDERGRPLLPSKTIREMRRGRAPEGANGLVNAVAFEHLWRYLDASGIKRNRVAAATVFRTGEFTNEMKRLRDACAALPDPIPHDLALLAEYEAFTVVSGKMTIPIWQDGERPYWTGGGKILFVNGEPVRRWDEEVRFAVSVPKKTMPTRGFPLLFYGNGQGGSYTQVFDRGGEGGDENIPGEGPGREFAERGIAALDIEAPTVGPRHPDGSTSGLAFPNFWNWTAFRDNIRQAASEFTMLAKMARHLRIPASMVPGAGTGGSDVFYDTDEFYFWGHSTGAGIGELVLAVEPIFRAGMLSGAGVSWIYNLVLKEEPIEFRPLVEMLLGEDEVDAFHPIPLLFQNTCDPAEAAYYAHRWITEPFEGKRPPHLFLLMGIVDRYFLPPMEDGLMVSAGVDLAGPAENDESLDALRLSGRSHLDLPVSGNVAAPFGPVTAAALQFRTPGDLDGHYAPFALPEARRQYSDFFASLSGGSPPIIPGP